MHPLSIATTLALATAASASTYTVGVGRSEVTGQPGIGFDPTRTVISDVTVNNEVVFQFLAGIHRVVQVSPDAPCTPSGGYDSGVQRVQAGTLQGSGPNATYSLSNNSDVLYFADIGDDNSPCYLGAVFCINTDERTSTACHTVIDAAKAIGRQNGVSTTPAAPGASAALTSGASSTSSATSTSSTVASSTTASRSTSSTAPTATHTNGSNGAGALRAALGVVALGGAAAALLA